MIEAHLPPYERASALVEAYLQNLSWSLCTVDRQQLYEELLPALYKRKPSEVSLTEDRIHPHDLALILTVFAVGAAGDLTLKLGNDEALYYEHLARAALGISSILSSASLSAVQATCLLGYITVYTARKSSLEEAWRIISLGMSLASSVSDISRNVIFTNSYSLAHQIGLREYTYHGWRLLANNELRSRSYEMGS